MRALRPAHPVFSDIESFATTANLAASPTPPAENLVSLGYLQMTPIQAQSLPPGTRWQRPDRQGKTGSGGKTAAFGLGLLSRLDVNCSRYRFWCSARPASWRDQVATGDPRVSPAPLPNVKLVTLCGGTPTALQSTTLGFGAHYRRRHPGPILKHLEQDTPVLDGPRPWCWTRRIVRRHGLWRRHQPRHRAMPRTSVRPCSVLRHLSEG